MGPLRLGYRKGSAWATVSGSQTSQISGEQAVSRPSESPSKVKRRVSISGYVFFCELLPGALQPSSCIYRRILVMRLQGNTSILSAGGQQAGHIVNCKLMPLSYSSNTSNQYTVWCRYCNGGREDGLNEDVQAVGRDRGLDGMSSVTQDETKNLSTLHYPCMLSAIS